MKITVLWAQQQDGDGVPHLPFSALQQHGGNLLRIHFGSSGCFTHGNGQAVSGLAFTSPHFFTNPRFGLASHFAFLHVSVLCDSSLSRHPSLLTSRRTTQLMLKSQQTPLMSHTTRVRRPSRTQILPTRAVLTWQCAFLLLASPALAMVSLAPARLPPPACLSMSFFP